MIKIEQLTGAAGTGGASGRRQRAADEAAEDVNPRTVESGLEVIPEVVAPPILARNAVMIGRELVGGDVVMSEDGEEGVRAEGGNMLAKGGAEGVEVTKKRKRNKPTLSCGECVERKTKVRSLEISDNMRVFGILISWF